MKYLPMIIVALSAPFLIYWTGGGNFVRNEDLGMTMFLSLFFGALSSVVIYASEN